MEGDQIGHGQDGMNHERCEWLFIPADAMIQGWKSLCRLFWKQLLQLCSLFSFTAIDPNYTVIENVRTLSIADL